MESVMQKFNVGDKVLVYAVDYDDPIWVPDMEDIVGHTHAVVDVASWPTAEIGNSRYEYLLDTNGPKDGYWFPQHVLSLVYSSVPKEDAAENWKDTNPKDAVGIKKVPLSCVSAPVLAELGIGMLEGARKYGRHNYRVSKVRSSVYYDATMRHMMQWWEGEDIDPDSGLSHITKAIASLVVLRDAMIQEQLVDDRPPATYTGWMREMQVHVDDLFEKYPDAKEAFTNDGIQTQH